MMALAVIMCCRFQWGAAIQRVLELIKQPHRETQSSQGFPCHLPTGLVGIGMWEAASDA